MFTKWWSKSKSPHTFLFCITHQATTITVKKRKTMSLSFLSGSDWVWKIQNLWYKRQSYPMRGYHDLWWSSDSVSTGMSGEFSPRSKSSSIFEEELVEVSISKMTTIVLRSVGPSASNKKFVTTELPFPLRRRSKLLPRRFTYRRLSSLSLPLCSVFFYFNLWLLLLYFIFAGFHFNSFLLNILFKIWTQQDCDTCDFRKR